MLSSQKNGTEILLKGTYNGKGIGNGVVAVGEKRRVVFHLLGDRFSYLYSLTFMVKYGQARIVIPFSLFPSGLIYV